MEHSIYSVLTKMAGKVYFPVNSIHSDIKFIFPDNRPDGGIHFVVPEHNLVKLTSVSRSQAGSVTGTFVMTGDVFLPKNKWLDTTLPRNAFQQRSFVKQSKENNKLLEITSPNLIVYMDYDTHSDLVSEGIELHYADEIINNMHGYSLCLQNYPMYSETNEQLSLDNFVESYLKFFELKARQKALNYLIEEETPAVSSIVADTLKLLSDSDATEWFSSLGMDKMEINPNSMYTSKPIKSLLSVKLKSLSSLPSKSALDKKKLKGGSLTKSEQILENAFTFFDGLTQKQLIGERKVLKRELNHIDDCVLSHMTSNIAYGGKWFSGCDKNQKIDKDVTVMGVETTITIDISA